MSMSIDTRTVRASTHSRKHRRATCTAIRVNDGDSCGKLATRCGISPADFTEYNPSSTLCPTLLAGQHVCCSAGTLPDYFPQPNVDGTCATYTIQNNDWCSKIAAAKSITVDEIEDWNEKMWGWTGCDNLLVGGKHRKPCICSLDRSDHLSSSNSQYLCQQGRPANAFCYAERCLRSSKAWDEETGQLGRYRESESLSSQCLLRYLGLSHPALISIRQSNIRGSLIDNAVLLRNSAQEQTYVPEFCFIFTFMFSHN